MAIISDIHGNLTVLKAGRLFLIEEAIRDAEKVSMPEFEEYAKELRTAIYRGEKIMTIKYEVTMQDYIDFNLNFIDTSKVMKRSIFIKRFFYPVIFLAVASLLESAFSLPIEFLLIVVAIVSATWIIFYVKWFKQSVVKKVEKLLSSGKVKGLIGMHELELGVKQLTDTTVENFTQYEAVEKVVETDKHIFVYVSQAMAYIIPKNTFETQEALEAFLEQIKQYQTTENTKFRIK